MRTSKFVLGLLLITLLSPKLVYAASFECVGKRTPLEVFICGDAELSGLDSDVARTYFTTLHATNVEAARQKIIDDQKIFLKRRTISCPIPLEAEITVEQSDKIIECLRTTYHVRLQNLHAPTADITQQQVVTNTISPAFQYTIASAAPVTAEAPIPAPMSATATPAIIMPEPIKTPESMATSAVPSLDVPGAASQVGLPNTLNESTPEPVQTPAIQPQGLGKSDPIENNFVPSKPQVSNSVDNVSPHHDTSSDGWLPILVILGLCYKPIWRTLQKINQMRKRNTINKTYSSVSTIGSFANLSSFMTSLSGQIKPDSSELIPANIFIAKPVVNSHADWTAQKGRQDESAYNTAKILYRQQKAQWQIGKVQFEQMQKMQASIDGKKYNSFDQPKYSVSPPKEPNPKDFISYSAAKGETTSRVNHDYIVASRSQITSSARYGELTIDLSSLNNTMVAVYKNVFDKINTGAIRLDSQMVTTFKPFDEDGIFQQVLPDVVASLKKGAKNQLGEYFQELTIDAKSIEYQIERNEFEFPIGVVIGLTFAGKIQISFHDHKNPEIIISKYII